MALCCECRCPQTRLVGGCDCSTSSMEFDCTMANPLSGNLYSIASSVGAGFPTQGGPGSWTVADDCEGTLTVVTDPMVAANHGNYVYTPSAAQQAAANTLGSDLEVTCTLTFSITMADGCSCTVTTPICFSVPPSVDPCALRTHPAQSFTDVCELNASVDGSGATGFNSTVIYSLCSGQDWSAFGGVAPTVLPDGTLSWNPPLDYSNSPLNHTFQVCANSSDPAGCSELPFDVSVSLTVPVHGDVSTSTTTCDLSYQILDPSADGLTNPVYSLCPDETYPAGFAVSAGGLVTHGYTEAEANTTQTYNLCVVGDEGCASKFQLTVNVADFCSNVTISFPT